MSYLRKLLCVIRRIKKREIRTTKENVHLVLSLKVDDKFPWDELENRISDAFDELAEMGHRISDEDKLVAETEYDCFCAYVEEMEEENLLTQFPTEDVTEARRELEKEVAEEKEQRKRKREEKSIKRRKRPKRAPLVTEAVKPCPREGCQGTYVQEARIDVVYFCGVPELLCNECQKLGFTIESGHGGATRIRDSSGLDVETKEQARAKGGEDA